MRKFFATTLVALVALTMVLAAVGCGQKTESTTETTPATEMPAQMDTSSMMADTAMADTSMHQ